MIYTEEAVEFFYRSMVGIYSIAEKMRDFFSDERALARAISEGSMLLGSPLVELATEQQESGS